MADTASFGWVGLSAQDPSKPVIQQQAARITLEINPWSSANVTTYVAALLLQDVMGVNVSLSEYGDYENIFARIATGQVDGNLETWPNSRVALYQQYVVQLGAVEDLGLVGYTGKTSWFLPASAVNANPSKIFDSWRSYYRADVLALLPLAGTTTPARKPDGSWLCDTATFSYCSNGMFVPPQCQGNPAMPCREFWSINPALSPGSNEQRIISLNLPLVVVYLGSDFLPAVQSCAAQASACIFHYWKPEVLVSTTALTRINLPEYSSTCLGNFSAARVGQPGNSLTCDWTVELLTKLGRPALATETPHVYNLLRFLTFRDVDIDALLADLARTGYEAGAAACNWIMANRNIWSSWIPAPPADYIKTLEQIEPNSPLSASLLTATAGVVVAAILSAGGLVRFARHDPIVQQAPVYQWLVVVSVLLAGGSVATLLVPATTDVCIARTWLLAMAWTIFLGATAVKTWYTYLTFGNRRMSVNPPARRVLLPAVGIAVALDAAMLAAWTSLADPGPTATTVSVKTFTLVCRPRAATSTAYALTTALNVFHGLLLLTAARTARRIRRVRLPYRENRAVAGVMSVVLLAGAVAGSVSLSTSVTYFAEAVVQAVATIVAMAAALGALVMRPIWEAHKAAKKGGGKVATGNDGKSAASDGSKFETPRVASSTILESATLPSTPIEVPSKGANLRPGSGSAAGTGSGADDRPANGEDPTTVMATRVGINYAMQKVSGVFRTWTDVHLLLFSSPCPVLLIADAKDQSAPCRAYTTNLQAAKIDANLAKTFPGCFLLRVDGTGWIVQTTDAAAADSWVAEIETVFKDVAASHSPAQSMSMKLWSATANSGGGGVGRATARGGLRSRGGSTVG
ncbi:hypothetical protein GGF31_008651 [Allomyces arbusculus]|nr:hypothetical protein GGF31_008651 [Allomyces arbusculus]